MQLVLLDVFAEKIGDPFFNVIDVEENHANLTRLLGCDWLELAMRKIGEHYYDILCDEEGLLKENRAMSAVDLFFRERLYGNLIIAKHNDNGEMVGLTNDEVLEISRNIVTMCTDGEIGVRSVLTYCA